MNHPTPKTEGAAGETSLVLQLRFSVCRLPKRRHASEPLPRPLPAAGRGEDTEAFPPSLGGKGSAVRFCGGSTRALGLLAIGTLLWCAAGCDGDYRAQVEKTHERMALLDAENALLEEPAILSEGEVAVYFRPPRGVAIRPSEKSQPPSTWLFHLPWTETRSLVPPLEILVGAINKGPGEKLDDFLQSKVLEHLRQHADERLTPRPGESPRDLMLTHETDSPHDRRPVQYRHFAYRSEQESPQWPAPERPRLPQRCIYHYDVYITDAGELWGVVVVKSLNVDATHAGWRKAKVAPDVLARLPQKSALQIDPAQHLEAREASLSTLVVGPRARARLRALGR
jgi:hypothetical protein